MSSLYLRGNYSAELNQNLEDLFFLGKIKIIDDAEIKSEY